MKDKNRTALVVSNVCGTGKVGEIQMAWRQRATDLLADMLRFAVRGSLLVGGIAVAVAFSYIVIKTCWFTVRLLDRTWFAEPW